MAVLRNVELYLLLFAVHIDLGVEISRERILLSDILSGSEGFFCQMYRSERSAPGCYGSALIAAGAALFPGPLGEPFLPDHARLAGNAVMVASFGLSEDIQRDAFFVRPGVGSVSAVYALLIILKRAKAIAVKIVFNRFLQAEAFGDILREIPVKDVILTGVQPYRNNIGILSAIDIEADRT